MPFSQRAIVLLLLYTMQLVKPENELPSHQQHLAAWFTQIALNMEEFVNQPQQSLTGSHVGLQKSFS